MFDLGKVNMSCKSLACGAILFMLALVTHGETQTPLSNELECVHPPYKVYVASKSPLVMYLEGFITPEERRHLLELAYGFAPPTTSSRIPNIN